jgi:hypothetical protein
VPAPDYLHVPAEGPIPQAQEFNPFRAIVIVEQSVTPAWRIQLSDWLVASGCIYAVAWGEECHAWDESIDQASLAQHNYEPTPDDRFVMTTWHEDETIDEAFWFAESCALHPTVELERTLIIDIAASPRRDYLIGRYEKAIQEH